MREDNESHEDLSGPDLYQEIEFLIRENPRAWQSIAALTCLIGGVLAPLMGAALDVIAWLDISERVNPRLNVLSIISCALAIPLLGLGAHFLDLLQAKTFSIWGIRRG